MDNEKEQKKDSINIDKKVASEYYNNLIKEYLIKSVNSFDNLYKEQKIENKTPSDICNDIKSMENHNLYYDNILKTYSENLGKSLNQKHELKNDFYYVCRSIFGWVCYIFTMTIIVILCLLQQGIGLSENMVHTLAVAAFGAFFTSFIAIPIIISKYLFNPDEEKNTMEIVKNIQSHDKVIRSGAIFGTKKPNNEK